MNTFKLVSNVQVSVKLPKGASSDWLPKKGTTGSAAYDVKAWLPDGPVTIHPGEIASISTGLSVEFPEGYVLKQFSRSGLACKHGLMQLNSTGIVDSDYRGEVKAAFYNANSEPYTVNHGERIAQWRLEANAPTRFERAEELSDTTRGQGGFGSTGRT